MFFCKKRNPASKIYFCAVPHFVYMLLCKGNRIYTGYATDVNARFKTHQEGKGAKFTKAFPPIQILKVFELETKHAALRLESLIKKQSVNVKWECVKLPDKSLPAFFSDPVSAPRASSRQSRRKRPEAP